ncbi:MAG: phasin family protein [Xanthomonadales bacterium]|nr:phasin family protein [Xanthomonadales bacterium]
MAKKTLKKKVQAKPDVSKFAEPVMESAREIWLAGLGAFSVAQQESGKLLEQGSKLFDKLVSEGSKLEKQTRSTAKGAANGIKGGVESRVDAVRQQASDNWDKLEGVFEDRVARVLGRLGVPTADDVNKLSARVQQLSREVSKMGAQSASGKTTKKRTSKKAASKKAASAS